MDKYLDLSNLNFVAPSNEMMEALQYEPEDERSITEQTWVLNEDHGIDGIPDKDDDDVEYATYDDKSTDVDVPSLNEDDELPPYSIFARYWQTEKPLKYPRAACGHKFRAEFEPKFRNCEQCWFTYFQVHGELTQAVEEAYQKGGGELIKKLRGPKFLDNFLKFMATVALIKAQQEAVAKEKQIDTSLDSSRTEQES